MMAKVDGCLKGAVQKESFTKAKDEFYGVAIRTSDV